MIKAPPQAPGLTTLQMSNTSLQNESREWPSPQQCVTEQDCCPHSEHQHSSSCGLLQTFLDANKRREDTPFPTSAAAGPRERNPKPKGDQSSQLPSHRKSELSWHTGQAGAVPWAQLARARGMAGAWGPCPSVTNITHTSQTEGSTQSRARPANPTGLNPTAP